MVTSDAAEFLGRESTLGTVEEGKQADLVLLDANPIENVAALHAITGVVRAGRYHPAAA
jgi:imidazolonepropionase-like amidohydrolase